MRGACIGPSSRVQQADAPSSTKTSATSCRHHGHWYADFHLGAPGAACSRMASPWWVRHSDERHKFAAQRTRSRNSMPSFCIPPFDTNEHRAMSPVPRTRPQPAPGRPSRADERALLSPLRKGTTRHGAYTRADSARRVSNGWDGTCDGTGASAGTRAGLLCGRDVIESE